jgi:uncharacterized protein (TIGR02145 family)
MKNSLFLLIAILWCSIQATAQVGFKTDTTGPDPSAMLDVQSTSRGFLPPRMTSLQRGSIANPTAGLIVFCTDCGTEGSGVLSVFSNGQWGNYLSNCSLPAMPAAGVNIPYPTQIIWQWKGVATALGYKWNTTPNISTAIDINLDSTFHTESNLQCNTSYTRYVWAWNTCGYSSPTMLTQLTSSSLSPVSGINVISSPTQIIWHWNPVAGAIGYKWNTSNNSATAEDMGLNTSKTESGLVCGTNYTRYVWAYNSCGTSGATLLNQTLILNPSSPVAGTNTASPSRIIWNWISVSGATGYKWSAINNIATAEDRGVNTLKTEYGLTCNTSYVRYVWAYAGCGFSPATTLTQATAGSPDPPDTGIHIPSRTQIVWKWDTVSGATGYKWNTINDYVSATEMGTTTTKTETGLLCSTYYTRYVFAYDFCGHSASKSLTQRTSLCAIVCGTNLTDTRNGKIYPTVQIGTQCWLKQNMNIGIKIDSSKNQTNNDTIEKYCYSGAEANCDVYGGLYQWGEMVQYLNGASNTSSWNPVPSGNVQGICPEGWHIPYDYEWTALTNPLGGSTIAGGKMKEAGLTHWAAPNTGATNESGFTALPGGYRNGSNLFQAITYWGYFWSSTESSNIGGWIRWLDYSTANANRTSDNKGWGLSVRCIND